MNTILALADGSVFRGVAFGRPGTVSGILRSFTNMSGYQELLSDPANYAKILSFSYPHIGNGGIVPEDHESDRAQIMGLIIHELSPVVSNYRATQSLHEYLYEQRVLGIEGIDTRELATRLRKFGKQAVCITTELDEADAVQHAKFALTEEEPNLVKQVSTITAYDWKGDSRIFTLPNATTGVSGNYLDLEETKYEVVLYDFGVNRNTLRRLRQAQFNVHVVQESTSAEEVLMRNPQGVFLSSGPGNPAMLSSLHREVAKLLASGIPIVGISLGAQILAHSLGASTSPLAHGHHGCNIPVKNLQTGKVSITKQNNDYAIQADSLSDDVEITHVNLNDQSIAGIRSKKYPAYGVQFCPESAPGPNDDISFFRQFAELIEKTTTA